MNKYLTVRAETQIFKVGFCWLLIQRVNLSSSNSPETNQFYKYNTVRNTRWKRRT